MSIRFVDRIVKLGDWNWKCSQNIEYSISFVQLDYSGFVIYMNSLQKYSILFTQGVNNLPIKAIFYYINTLDIQLCRRGRAMSTILYFGDFFIKLKYNLQSNGHSGEFFKLCLDFLCNACIT